MKKTAVIIFCLVSSLLWKEGGSTVYAQQPNNIDKKRQRRIDSILNLTREFDEKKKELGNNSSDMEDTVKVKLLDALWGQYMRFDSEKATEYAQKELELSQAIGYKKGIADSYVRLGIISDEKSDYLSALDYDKKALKIQYEIDDKNGEAQSLNTMGVIYSKTGNFPEALKNLMNSLSLSLQYSDVYSIGCVYNNIGIIYKIQNYYEDALKNYFFALKEFKKIDEKYGEASVCNNIGGIYLNQGKLEEAMKYELLSLKIYQELKEKEGEGEAYGVIGSIYLKKKLYPEALKNLQTALEIRKGIKDQYGLSSNYITLGDVYFKQGNSKQAIENINEGLRIAKEIGILEYMKNAYKSLAEIYDSIGDYKLAYQNGALFKQMNDSMFNADKQKKVTELKMNYEQSKKDAIAEQKSENEKLTRNAIVLVLILIVVFLIISLIQRNRIAAVRKRQALEEERNRISRDLHDDLGSGLTGIMMMSEQMQWKENPELIDNTVDKIKQTSRQMVDQMGDIVWAMNSKNDTLESLIGYIRTYAHDFYDNQPAKLHFQLPEKIPFAETSGIIRRNVFLVVKETLNNIYKYANASNISFEIEMKGREMSILIKDDGIGFEMGQTRKFGNGLKNMKIRMESIGGKFKIDSAPGKGTITIIRFPLK